MKIKTLIPVIVCLCLCLCSTVFGQTPQQNLDKYWAYRTRFFDKFILDIDPNSIPVSAPGNGINTPAAVYNPTQLGPDENSIRWGGDGTVSLSEYIAAMATEYQLQDLHNLDVSNAQTKIYRALNAFNRLDSIAEPTFGCGGSLGNPPCYTYSDINGFFLRSDTDIYFLDYWGTHGKSSWDPTLVDNIESGYQKNIENPGQQVNEVSQDQVWNMMLAWALVRKFVGATEDYEDQPCEYEELADIAKLQTFRSITYMQTYDLTGGWSRKPRGHNNFPGKWIPVPRLPYPLPLQIWRIHNNCMLNTPVALGGSFLDLLPFHQHFIDAGNWITEQDFGNLNYSIAPLLTLGLGGLMQLSIPVKNNFYNNGGKLYLSTIANNENASTLEELIGNMRKVADYFNQRMNDNPYDVRYFWADQLPMISALLHNKSIDTPIFGYYYSHIEQLLNEAPAGGPSSYVWPPTDYIWATPALWRKPIGEVMFGKPETNDPPVDRSDLIGEYNGLDYLLLFNLYHLVYESYFNDPVSVTIDYPSVYTYPSYNYEYDDEYFDIGHEDNAAYYTIHSKDLISMNSTVNANGKMGLRGNEVLLQTGFEVKYGGEFTAETNAMMELDFTPPSGNYKMAHGSYSNAFDGTNTREEDMITEESVDARLQDQVRVFPNPVNTVLQIEGYYPIIQLELYNSNGILVHQIRGEGYEQMNLDVSDYQPGLYILSITTDKGFIQVQKVVVE